MTMYEYMQAAKRRNATELADHVLVMRNAFAKRRDGQQRAEDISCASDLMSAAAIIVSSSAYWEQLERREDEYRKMFYQDEASDQNGLRLMKHLKDWTGDDPEIAAAKKDLDERIEVARSEGRESLSEQEAIKAYNDMWEEHEEAFEKLEKSLRATPPNLPKPPSRKAT